MQNACGAESGEYFSTSLACLTAWSLDVGLKHAITTAFYWWFVRFWGSAAVDVSLICMVNHSFTPSFLSSWGLKIKWDTTVLRLGVLVLLYKD